MRLYILKLFFAFIYFYISTIYLPSVPYQGVGDWDGPWCHSEGEANTRNINTKLLMI